MPARISRRKLSEYVAGKLLSGDKTALSELAAHLIETRRTKEADLIVRDIESALQSKGVLVADIESAHGLESNVRESLSDYLKKHTSATKVVLREQIDESLIGGVRVHTPDATLDTTIRRKLNALKASKQQ